MGAEINIPALAPEAETKGYFYLYSPNLNQQGISTSYESWPFYIIFQVDPLNSQPEPNETNNVRNTYLHRVYRNHGRHVSPGDTSYDNLMMVVDLSNNVVWKKGGEPFNMSQLKRGLYVFKSQVGDNIITEKVFRE